MSSANTISAPAPTAMLACVLFAVSFVVCECVTVHRKEPDIHTKSREELSSLHILCNLTDIVIISAPTAGSNNSFHYYLYNPDNEVRKIDITPLVKPSFDKVIDILENKTHKVTNLNVGQEINSTKQLKLKNNEFVIGPVGAKDHGNWVLSVYFKENGSWVEQFQVITIEIVEYVLIKLRSSDLVEGDILELGFAYPLPDLLTCELIPPEIERPYDRWYVGTITKVGTCNYVLPNLTLEDSGRWEIVGVGKIVYRGHTTLTVRSKASSSRRDKTVQSTNYTSYENIIQQRGILDYIKFFI